MSQAILTVIVYDVSSDRKRTKLHSLLKEYGIPVQKSAFEARLTHYERQQVLERISSLLDPKTDRLTIYPLSGEQEERVLTFGLPRPKVTDPPYYLV